MTTTSRLSEPGPAQFENFENTAAVDWVEVDVHGLRVGWTFRGTEVAICSVSGDVGLVTTPALDRIVDQAFIHSVKVVAADLSEVDFLSAAGVRVLLLVAERAKRYHRRFVLVGCSAPVLRVLHCTGADKALTGYRCLSDMAVSEQVDLLECEITTEWALRHYTREVGANVGLEPESCWCEVAEQCTAYLPLPCAPVSAPDREAALVWDEAHGWAIGIETSSGEDLLIQAWYGPDRTPDPRQVAAFARAVLTGRPAGQSTPPAPPAGPVRAQLARWVQTTAHLSDSQQQNG